jgi:hypothetical protein
MGQRPSPEWPAHGLPGCLIPLLVPEVPADAPPSATAVDLPGLIDHVIASIDEVLANWNFPE